MRSLSAHDLFKDEIDYSPLRSELEWFKDYAQEVYDPEVLMEAFTTYNQISLFHEQNHRLLWRLLPPAPQEQQRFLSLFEFRRKFGGDFGLSFGRPSRALLCLPCLKNTKRSIVQG